jgi:hypothetical protein
MHVSPTTLSDHFNTFTSFAPSINEYPSLTHHISFLAAVLFRVRSVELLHSEHVDLKSTGLSMSAIHATQQTILIDTEDLILLFLKRMTENRESILPISSSISSSHFVYFGIRAFLVYTHVTNLIPSESHILNI